MSKKSGGHGPWLLSANPAARWPALERFRTAPRVRSVMRNHFYVFIVDLPWSSTSSLRKPCKKGVEARNNSRIKSGGRHGGGGWYDDIGTSLFFPPSRSARSRGGNVFVNRNGPSEG